MSIGENRPPKSKFVTVASLVVFVTKAGASFVTIFATDLITKGSILSNESPIDISLLYDVLIERLFIQPLGLSHVNFGYKNVF